MNQDPRWLEYLLSFHASRDYYACHDFLEEWWFEIGNPQNHLLMGFIQLAVGLYHWRADNFNGAHILFDKCTHIFIAHKEELDNYGIDNEALLSLLHTVKLSVNHREHFYDVNLTFSDHTLEVELNTLALTRNLSLYALSDLHNPHLVHKHKLKYLK